MTMHTQCFLSRGTERQVSWIPQDIALEGRIVNLREADKTWDTGWLVERAYTSEDSRVVAERGQDYKRTRIASDI